MAVFSTRFYQLCYVPLYVAIIIALFSHLLFHVPLRLLCSCFVFVLTLLFFCFVFETFGIENSLRQMKLIVTITMLLLASILFTFLVVCVCVYFGKEKKVKTNEIKMSFLPDKYFPSDTRLFLLNEVLKIVFLTNELV
jgi:hypothetical protein